MPTITLRPLGVGSQAQNTPIGASENWDCVNDPTSDGNATYLRNRKEDPLLDLFTVDTTDVPEDITVTSIAVFAIGKSNALQLPPPTPPASITPSLKIDGELQEGTNHPATGSYAPYSDSWTGEWTKEDISAMEIGVQISAGVETGNEGRVTQVYAVIDYTEN